MGVYIGCIEISGDFYNFKPIAEIKDSQIIQLGTTDINVLLPKSIKQNINLSYDLYNPEEPDRMQETLKKDSLMVFEFTTDDLDDNYKKYTGERNQTGYKVNAIQMLDTKKIRKLENEKLYYAIEKETIRSNFISDTIVEIVKQDLTVGDKVFVEFEDVWTGPYEVAYREETASYYIKPQIKDNKYTIPVYKKEDMDSIHLNYFNSYGEFIKSWTVIKPQKGVVATQKDLLTDELLIESFKNTVEKKVISKGKIELNDIPKLLEEYNTSLLSGSKLTESIRNNRIERLRKILSSEDNIWPLLKNVADFIYSLLIEHKDDPIAEKWLKYVIEKNPLMLEDFKEKQPIAKELCQMEAELDNLSNERRRLEQDVRELNEKKDQLSNIDEAAIAAKKKEMIDMDAEYNEKAKRVEDICNKYNLGQDIEELKKEKTSLEKNINESTSNQRYLSGEIDKLKREFESLVDQHHHKMVNIAFDGFMANKMFQAAAKWENNNKEKHYKELINKVNEIEINEQQPSQLVDYLCKIIKVNRPSYSKNTIINIAICITQGFLTVFSGEPGCGKTSICNYFGEALGLNKISKEIECADTEKDFVNRYTSVSVERGWTSKRDFIGYFNPLSKMFDKSNRKIYEALKCLDYEKKSNPKINKFPYLILLDEANLSPMEYYWSEFMNICDDLKANDEVNLGDDFVFKIPDTLHFLATINNDHTTETLSPRLIDRAWIITLPYQSNLLKYEEKEIPVEEIKIVTWNSLRNAFIPKDDSCELTPEIQDVYNKILLTLRKQKITVSPRIDKAIKRYWVIANKFFEEETKTRPEFIALDYAIAQRFLPKIVGNGELYEKWLTDFKNLCSSNDLNMSAKILDDIITRGNQQMRFYQFFY